MYSGNWYLLNVVVICKNFIGALINREITNLIKDHENISKSHRPFASLL